MHYFIPEQDYRFVYGSVIGVEKYYSGIAIFSKVPRAREAFRVFSLGYFVTEPYT